MELTLNEIENMMQDVATKAATEALTRMIKSNQGLEPMNLENCTDDAQDILLSDTKGEDQMAYKYRERVDVIENGQAVTKWACGNTIEEKQKAMYGILSKYGKYTPAPITTPIKTRPWNEYAWEWFNTYKRPKLKPKTVTTRQCYMKKYVVPAFGDRPIDQISRKDVADALNQNNHLSKSYMREIMNYMKGIFKAAKEEELIRVNPMDSDLITNPCKREAKREALSDSDKADIIAHIPDIQKPMDRLFMAFLMFTAMRPGEIFALRWEDIDFERRSISVLRGSSFDKGKILIGEDGETKTGWSGVRTIPLHEQLMDYLLPLRQPEGFIFCRDTKGHEGEPFSEQAHKRQWERIKKQIDVHGMTPYVGRHTYLTELAHNGVTLDTAMRVAGHKDERMLTRVYLHANDSHVKAAGQAMEGFFKGLAASCD